MDSCDLEPHKYISQLLAGRKKRTTAILSQKNCFTAIWSMKKWFPAIWKLKNWFTANSSLKNCFAGILREKKWIAAVTQIFRKKKMWIPAIITQKNVVHNALEQVKEDDCYFKPEKQVDSYLEHDKHLFQLFGN